ncbi:FAD-dependent oxidoreductase [Nocardioides sp. HM23]|uniref:FAD-dependent oxidoreductase n=1 Tax=Nocardioides bizhenqiangii TaxID=3095076 RepID=UPI002ACA369E|nr:FAD-dependent oxidoreductase [Nocardioides sp. HM23]MDZ5619958.1 FAD-dependent oxidoreductase [Nocardioides sp. HM23]
MTTQTESISYDVLVIGAGPSGLATAIAATRAGARVLVLERHQGTSTFPKATGVRPRTMEILRSWGLEQEVQAGGADLRLAAALSATLADRQQQDFSLGIPQPETLAALSPSVTAISPQDHLEPVLLAHLRSLGGAVRFHTELVELDQHDGGVSVRVRAGDDGAEERIEARYVVGADGGGSTVRRATGINEHQLGSEGEHLAVLFHGAVEERIRGHRYGLHIVTTPESGVFVPSGTPGRWVYDREWSADRDAQGVPTVEDHQAAIRMAAGMPDLDPEIVGVFRWTFGAAVAERMQNGRVFLVGDAAHRTTPRGATGMNTGIADGHNLGWKLGWVVRGWADEALLDSYGPERHPVGLRNALSSLEASDGGKPEDLAHDFGVVYPVPSGDAPAAQEYALPGAVTGARAPHAWVERDGRRVSLLDLYGNRLVLVTGRGGDAWRRAADELAGHGFPVAAAQLGHDLADPRGTAAGAYDLGDGSAVLVRPDGHIAWRADALPTLPLTDLAAAVHAALGWVPSNAPLGASR